MSKNPGLIPHVWQYFRGFLRDSVTFTGLVAIAALPAFVVALTWFPTLIGYLLVGLAMISIMSVGNHLRPDEETDDGSFDTERYDNRQLLFFAVALYTVLASSTSTVLLVGASLASLVSSTGISIVGTPTAGLVVAALFPLLDSEISKRFDHSVGKYGMLTAIWLLHAVGVLRDASPDQFERTVQRGLM